ncbi:hypothetical protein F2Q68_00011359 [Brassica cretica]|uniref:Uncharacterized protein n=1 Tax=Brassica cretica TaxID=69181 RepID=A0A8S9KN87_BRACR|nr:hypothetical protein F2Q68_00011359 [Brassica cretica]
MKEDNKILFTDLNSITDHVSRAYIESQKKKQIEENKLKQVNLTNMKKVSNTNIMDRNIEHHNIKLKENHLKENKFKVKIKCHQMTKKIISHIIIIFMKLIKLFRDIRLLC